MTNDSVKRKDSDSSSSSSSSSNKEKNVKVTKPVKEKTAEEIEEVWVLYREMPRNGKYLLAFLTAAILLTIATTVLGCYVEYRSTTYVGRVIIGFSVIGLLVYIYGLYTVYRFIKKVKRYLKDEKNKNPEEIDQSKSRFLLNMFFYLELIMTVVFIIIACICFFFGDEVKSVIDGWYVRPEKWEKYFGDVQYDTVMDNIKTILYTTGVISVILFVLQCFILHLGFKMIKGYRAWQVVLQFICVMFYISGFILIYLAIFAMRYKELSQVERTVPDWLPITLIVTGVIAVIVGIVGYVASYMENDLLLKVFAAVKAAFCLAILVFAIFSVVHAGEFKQYFENNCYNLMDGIDEQYLSKYLHCPQKYVEQNSTLTGLVCPKDRIAQMWEINKGKDVEDQSEMYGCLSRECCVSIYSSVKNKFNYLVLFGFLLFALGLLNLSGAIYMITKLGSDEEEGVGIGSTKIVLASIVAASTIIIIVLIMFIPPQPNPTPMELAVIDEAGSDATEIDADNVATKEGATEEETNKINEENQKNNEINTDNSKCEGGNCLDAQFNYTLTATNGTLVRSSFKLPESVKILEEKKQGDKYTIKFEGKDDSTKDYLKFFEFKHNCEMENAFTHVYVTASGTQKSFLQIGQSNETNPQVTLDASKLKEGENTKLVDTYLSYTLVDVTSPTKIRLAITERTGESTTIPAENAKVELKSKSFPNCPTTNYTVGKEGVFLSDRINQLKDNIYNDMELTVTYKEYSPVVLNVGVGGLGSQEFINLSPLEFVDPKVLVKVDLNTKVINTTTNSPVSNASVKLYKGRFVEANEADNEDEEKPTSLLELRMTKENTLVGEVESGDEGEVSFNGLGLGEYTIVTKKSDFYSENMIIKIQESDDGNLETITLTPKVKKGGLRFVLSWPNGPEDLDIYANFKMNRFLKCQVFFGRKKCGGVELDVDNYNGGRNGVETISIPQLGRYQYLFSVNKYVDVSNGIAPGENRDPNASEEEKKTIQDLALSESKATISIYNDEFEFALAKLEVPNIATAQTVMDEKDIKDPKDYSWWVGFCIDGTKGLSSLKVINKLSTNKESYRVCEDLYKE